MVAPIRLRCDGSDYAALGNLYAAAGKRAPLAIRRAVNRKGRQALVQVTRVVTQRLRIRTRSVRRRIKGRMISGTSYEIVARGKVPLSEFPTIQDGTGVKIDYLPKGWIEDADKLRIAFQGKKGAPANQPGNAAKRRGSLGGRIVYGTGKRRRQGFRSVGGVMVPEAFVDTRAQAAFEKVAMELPAELAHQLWVVVEGVDMRAQAARVARGGYLRKGR